MEAQLVDCDRKIVQLRRNGKLRRMRISIFSEADKVFLKQWYDDTMKLPTGTFKNVPVTRCFKNYFTTDIQKAAKKHLSGRKGGQFDTPLGDFDVDAAMIVDPEKDTFNMYVPADCRADTPFGVYVYLSPNNGGSLPKQYTKIFDEGHFICVSPCKVGNSEPDPRKIALALSSLETVKTKGYLIDTRRTYIGGFSGGGIISFMVHILYPQIFKGATSSARSVCLEERPAETPGRIYPPELPFFTKKEMAKLAKMGHRWVFVSGENDFNYKHVVAEIPQWKKNGFDVKFIDVPGMKHSNAPPTAFKEALIWVDSWSTKN